MAAAASRRSLTLPLAIGIIGGIVLTQFTPVGTWVWNLLYGLGAPMAAANVGTAIVIIGVSVAASLGGFLLIRRKPRR